MESPYLTTREAAEYLRYKSTAGIRQLVRRGELRPAGIGPNRCHLFTRKELDAFVKRRDSRAIRLATPTME